MPPSSVIEEASQYPSTVLQDADARVVAEEQLQQHDLGDAVDYVENLHGAKAGEDVVSVVSTCVSRWRKKGKQNVRSTLVV